MLAQISGVIGAIAGRNAARNPKRIALTAGALGVGLALLVGVATLGSSAKQSVRDQVGEQFLGDFTDHAERAATAAAARRPADGLADQVAQLPDVQAAAGLGATAVNIPDPGDDEAAGQARRRGRPDRRPARTLGLSFTDGGWDQLGADGVVVSKEHADDADMQARRHDRR